MMHVDDNIGGRHDRQKNNGLRTKTLAVGLLMLVMGCVVVGYFSATTTTKTTTAHTCVSSVPSPNVEGMVSNVEAYPLVRINNTAPYPLNARLSVMYLSPWCKSDTFYGRILSGKAWTARSRGVCLVTHIDAQFSVPGWHPVVKFTPYTSSGTAYAKFSIIMYGGWNNGDDGCCVRSSNQLQECP